MIRKFNYIILFVTLLFSFNIGAQIPDTNFNVFGSWKYDLQTGLRERNNFDTTVFTVNRHNPLLKSTSSYLYLGNIGSAAVSNIYNERLFAGFVFGSAYQPYIYDEKSFEIFKTKSPVSIASFTIGDIKEQEERTINILHTQNIDEYSNIGFKVNNINSIGHYVDHQVLFNKISIFGSHFKGPVKFLASANRNKFLNNEIGGFVDSTWEIKGQSVTQYENHFNEAVSEFRNQNINALLEYKLIDFRLQKDTLDTLSGNSLIIGQYTNIDQNYRKFNAGLMDFRDQVMIDTLQSNDSAFYRSITNRVYFKFRTGNQYITGGIENEFVKYSHRQIPDTIFHTSSTNNGTVVAFNNGSIIKNTEDKQYNFSLFGDIEINISDLLKLKFLGKYYLFGYQKLKTDLAGKAFLNLRKSNIEAYFGIKTRKPDYYYNHYISNLYEWNNNFNDTRELKLDVLLKSKEHRSGLRFGNYLLGNYIFFNENAHPQQYLKVLNIVSAQVFGEFSLGKFKTFNEVSLQSTTNENILPLPPYTVFHSFSFNQKLFNDVLHFNVGYDFNMYGKYKANAYEPVLGVFHTQSKVETGNYPFVDLFINFKVKRTLFYFKYEHVNELSSHLDDDGNQVLYGKRYYTTTSYLNPGRVFRFGLTWVLLN